MQKTGRSGKSSPKRLASKSKKERSNVEFWITKMELFKNGIKSFKTSDRGGASFTISAVIPLIFVASGSIDLSGLEKDENSESKDSLVNRMADTSKISDFPGKNPVVSRSREVNSTLDNGEETSEESMLTSLESSK